MANGAADEENGRYGPVALYVGGVGEVRFKDIGIKDLGKRVTPTETVSPRFKMLRLIEFQLRVVGISRGHQPRWHPRRRVRSALLPRAGLHRVARNCAQPDRQPEQRLREHDGALRERLDRRRLAGRARRPRTCTSIPARNCAAGIASPPACSAAARVSAYRDVDGDGKIDVINSSAAGVSFSRPGSRQSARPVDLGQRVRSRPVGRAWRRRRRHQRRRQGGHRQSVRLVGAAGRRRGADALEVPRREAGGMRDARAADRVAPRWSSTTSTATNATTSSRALEAHGWGLAWFEQKRDAAGEISFVRAH